MPDSGDESDTDNVGMLRGTLVAVGALVGKRLDSASIVSAAS